MGAHLLLAAVAGYLTFWYGRAGLDGILSPTEQVPEALDTALMVSAGSTYVGWLWWSVVACVNARRIRPLAGSPWLPVWIYVGGPLLLVGVRYLDAGLLRDGVLVVGAVTVAYGHFAVIGSLRSTARRVGAPVAPFTRLIVLPIALPFVQLALALVLSDDVARVDELTFLHALWTVFAVAMAAITWHAARALELACQSEVIRRRADQHTLPSGDVVAAALRRSLG
ncbi:MAG: hypothetical protein KDB40_23200 [Acidimicrobiales bacterium]|nr:hypothetical protein [Acidimicrobiales bacterium]